MNQPTQTILLIDDEPLIILTLERILTKKSYRVLKSSSKENAIEIMKGGEIDLVILDFYLSDSSGSDILASIRTYENFSNVPVIMLTSEESPDIIEKCLDSGATDFIIKPIIPKVLLARIRSALSNRANILQIEKQKEEIFASRQKLSEVLHHLEKDIRKARITQTTLIPSSYIKSEFFSMYSYYEPMIEVGGDFFSYIERGDNTDILFGDVSGHGISSAMVSCMAVLCFQTMQHSNPRINLEMEYLHNTLSDYVKGHYFTGVYLRFNKIKFTLEYAYAGHHNIFFIRENEVIELKGRGTPFILMKEFITNPETIDLKKGDRLFLFSDGLFEIFNIENELYGIEKFLENVKFNVNLRGKEFLTAVSNSAMEFAENMVKDDMTMLLIEF